MKEKYYVAVWVYDVERTKFVQTLDERYSSLEEAKNVYNGIDPNNDSEFYPFSAYDREYARLRAEYGTVTYNKEYDWEHFEPEESCEYFVRRRLEIEKR